MNSAACVVTLPNLRPDYQANKYRRWLIAHIRNKIKPAPTANISLLWVDSDRCEGSPKYIDWSLVAGHKVTVTYLVYEQLNWLGNGGIND